MTDVESPNAQASETAQTCPKQEQALPYTVIEPEHALPKVQLDALPDMMQQACARAKWAQLMPVQELSLPYIMAGRDIMIQSRTGSGKTGTYLLPLMPLMSPQQACVQALVLVPTRELAMQVEHEATVLFEGTGLRTAALYGGVGYGKQMDALRAGAHFVVGTPGRVLDHLLKRNLSLDTLRMLIFDEADRMLSIGFYPDMKEVQRYLPKRHVHTCLFSATYPPYVLKLAGEFLENASLLSLSQAQVHVAAVQHLYCECKPMDKDRALVRLLETENPASAMIFCNTKANVHYVTEVLRGFGYNAAELSADLTQARREAVLAAARDGKVQYLVATDVAARGIDIPDLSHVFLYEPPEDQESYIHRAGRTGRAGAAGTVISLVDVMQKMELQRIGKHYKISLIPTPTPTDDDVAAVVGNRLMAIMEARYRKLTALERMRVQRFTQLAASLSSAGSDTAENDDSQLALLGMLLDQAYQEALRTPPAAPQGKEEHARPQREPRERNARSPRPPRRENRDAQAEKPARSPHKSAETKTANPQASTPAVQDDAAEEAQRKSRRRRRSNRKPRPEGEAAQASNAQGKQED